MLFKRINNASRQAEWMTCPRFDTEFPGLAYIGPLDQLIVTKARDALHDIIGTRARISYTIFNNAGQKIFVAVRSKGCKKFTIKVYNNYGNEVIKVKRPFKFCVNRVLVWAPPGHFVGSVEQLCNKYAVKNEYGMNVLNIRVAKPLKLVYNIRYVCGVDPIGVIKEAFPLPETLNELKNFGVSFPVQLNVQDKAVLLGACFLIGCLEY